ncbi:hypothetical protein Syun_011622 [Stephania yunnanensis]|uniref:Uncharacterized protein n=1 Tax=Stephania yunnanensis TaxID=152371 RepID=A0AAP0PFM1_9MAGN
MRDEFDVCDGMGDVTTRSHTTPQDVKLDLESITEDVLNLSVSDDPRSTTCSNSYLCGEETLFTLTSVCDVEAIRS